MYELGLIIVSNVATVPVAYFVGYRLRRVVPQKRRFPIVFSTLLMMTLVGVFGSGVGVLLAGRSQKY